MSTKENVVLEAHVTGLTRVTFNQNVQNIPGLLHCHESFSTCVAARKILKDSRIAPQVAKHKGPQWNL